jgi:hypothetical protein
MDLCGAADIDATDHVEEWDEGFKVVIDAKSMLSAPPRRRFFLETAR